MNFLSNTDHYIPEISCDTFQTTLYAIDYASHLIKKKWSKNSLKLNKAITEAGRYVELTLHKNENMGDLQLSNRVFAKNVLSYFYLSSTELERCENCYLIKKSFPELLSHTGISDIIRPTKQGELTPPKIVERIAKKWIDYFADKVGVTRVKLNLQTKIFIQENNQPIEYDAYEFPGFNCFNYAFYKIDPSLGLSNNNNSLSQSIQASSHPLKEIKKKLPFILVKIPEKGDLVVYLNSDHYGIYIDNNLIESKWGAKGRVFQHPPGTTIYGNKYVYLRYMKQSKEQVPLIDPCQLTILVVSVLAFGIFLIYK